MLQRLKFQLSRPGALKFSVFDSKFGFYAKNYPENQAGTENGTIGDYFVRGREKCPIIFSLQLEPKNRNFNQP